jgi:hypothetical protein
MQMISLYCIVSSYDHTLHNPETLVLENVCVLTGNLDSLCDASASAAIRNNFVKRFKKSAKTSLNTSKVKSCAPTTMTKGETTIHTQLYQIRLKFK